MSLLNIKEFYGQSPGVKTPWKVTKVSIDSESRQGRVWVECARGVPWADPETRLSGVCREITRAVLEDGYVQIDETAVRYLDPGHGKTRTGYLWVMHRPGGGTVFQWRTSRAAECLESPD